MSQQPAVPWSLELYVQVVPPLWAAWAPLLWWADYCGWSGRLGCPQNACLPGSALYGGCLCCLVRLNHKAAGCTTLGDTKSSADSLMGRIAVQVISGLVPHQWSWGYAGYWEEETGPAFWLQGPGVTELVLDHCS